MVQSVLYTLDKNNSGWRKAGDGAAAPKSRAQDHAEVILYNRFSPQIKGLAVAAFVQDAAPCDSCHKAFLEYSKRTKFIFAIGKMGSGKEQGGSGYPALPKTTVIPIFLNSEGQEQNSTVAQYVLTRPQFFDPSALPALIYYAHGACYIGGRPEAFNFIDQGLLDALLGFAS